MIAYAEFLDSDGFTAFKHGESPTVHIVIASLFAAVIGSISFWGSVIAFLRLQETLPGRPIGIGKLQQPLNALLLIAAVAFHWHQKWTDVLVIIGIKAISPEGPTSSLWIVGVLVLSVILGLMVVLPIGGADMLVVISLLNALTGLSPAAAGLALDNQAMIVAGGGEAVSSDSVVRTAKATSAADAAIQMAYANQMIVVPGYGLAVAQAQHAVKDMAKLLESKGVEVMYAIHPVCRSYARSHECSSLRG